MITLKIGNEERNNGNIEEHWIAQQIRKRREDGTPIFVHAIIRQGDIDLLLSSAACSSGGGGGCQPNQKEQRLIDLWNKKGLNGQDIDPGMVISFLKTYQKYI